MGEIIKPSASIERTISEWTKLSIIAGQKLLLNSNGFSIIDATVPDGKRWNIHILVEIAEAPIS